MLKSVRVTQDGANFTGSLELSNSNTSVLFTPASPYKAGSRIDIFMLDTAADPSGLTLNQQYDAYFFVAAASSVTEMVQTGFGSAVNADAPLELAFDRPLDPKTVNGNNVWLRVGTKIIAKRGFAAFGSHPACGSVGSHGAPLEHVLTVGPDFGR